MKSSYLQSAKQTQSIIMNFFSDQPESVSFSYQRKRPFGNVSKDHRKDIIGKTGFFTSEFPNEDSFWNKNASVDNMSIPATSNQFHLNAHRVVSDSDEESSSLVKTISSQKSPIDKSNPVSDSSTFRGQLSSSPPIKKLRFSSDNRGSTQRKKFTTFGQISKRFNSLDQG